MRPTAEQILSFLDKANEIRDIHEVLPSDDPEACNKAIVEVFYDRFAPKWLSIDTAPKDGTDILIQSDGQVSVGRWHYHFVAGERWMGVCEGVVIDTNQDYPFVLSNPTGWMPLPESQIVPQS